MSLHKEETECVTVPDRNTAKKMLAWYRKNHRELPWRRDRDPYHIWISEIMLQQTRVAAVIGYYTRFMTELPDIPALASVEEERLLKLWEGLGYYNRARNLKKAAAEVMDRFQGRFPETYPEILGLPGIGAYTAGAIASICYDEPTPAVDGNVLRVYTRLTGDASCVDLETTKKDIRERLTAVYKEALPKERGVLTQCWMELGATVCVPNGTPLCGACPLKETCVAFRTDRTGELPVRGEKKRRRVEERTVFLFLCDGKVALHKRPESGLLAGLWEFPNVMGHLTLAEAMEQAERWGLQPSMPRMEVPYTHIFSHVEWHMRAYMIDCGHMADDLNKVGGIKWFLRKELEETAAVPSAFQPFRNLLKSGEEHS